MKNLWKHTWPCSQILSEFVATNSGLWTGTHILELGAGIAAIPSMTVLKCGAERVTISDAEYDALKLCETNVTKNVSDEYKKRKVDFLVLDWSSEKSVQTMLGKVEKLDFILGSDIFFDPSVFSSLVRCFRLISNKFPEVEFFIAYQNRDSNWSIEDLLALNNLVCVPIRCVDTSQHSIWLFKISNKMQTEYIFAGIEGGATHSTLIVLKKDGAIITIDGGPGLNMLLNGVERTADKIAQWIRSEFQKKISSRLNGAKLPITSLGLGLSGAEDEQTNQRLLEYLRIQHADLAHYFFLTSDAVIAVAATFDRGGIVLIAGTGSTCRLLKADGKVHGVGGWGHLIGDGASGFWIAMRCIRYIFDADDSFLSEECSALIAPEKVARAKNALLNHFEVPNKLALLDLLYGPKFEKANIASFCKRIAELAEQGDAFSLELFYDAGKMLARHIIAISCYFDKEMFDELHVLVVGSVFKSWNFLRPGFVDYIQNNSHLKKIQLFTLSESTVIGAAILGAKHFLSQRQNNSSSSANDTADITCFLEGLVQKRKLFDELL